MRIRVWVVLPLLLAAAIVSINLSIKINHMNTKLLGALGMVGAPFFLLAFFPGAPWFAKDHDTSLQGLFSLIYMLGWMCSIIGLMQLKATGNSRWGRLILIIELVLLSLANCWNIWNMLREGKKLKEQI